MIGRRRQRGSMAVTIGMFMLIGVVLLESLVLGYQFYMRRQMQNVADLAALAGAQALSGMSCTAALAAARSNAALNDSATVTVDCGNWNLNYTTKYNYQTQTASSTLDPNAVHVLVTKKIPFGTSWLPVSNAGAEAIAIRNGTPIAVFTIAANLLTGMVCSGNGCGAIANVNLTLFSLLKALGLTLPVTLTVGQLDTLLSSQVLTYGNILSAIGTATGLSTLTATVNVPSLLNKNVSLLTTVSGRGLFTFDSSAASSAVSATSLLNTQLNVLDLVTTGVGLASQNNAIGLSSAIPGITVQVDVLSPPSIGIGGVGATAYSAVIRVYANITTSPSSGVLSGVLQTLAQVASVNLPMQIDIANAQATVTSLCTTKDSAGNDTATFSASSAVMQACIGNITPSSVMSGTTSCTTGAGSKQIISILGTVLSVTTPGITDTILPAATGSYTLEAGQTAVTDSNTLAIGTAMTTLMTTLGSQLQVSILGLNTGGLLSALFNALVQPVILALQPVLNLLGSTVATLLNSLLGVEIGKSTLTLRSLNCLGSGVRLVE